MKPGTRRRSTPQRIAAAAVLALLVHALGGVAIYRAGVFRLAALPPAGPAQEVETAEIELSPGPGASIESLVERLDQPDEPTPQELEQRKEEEKTKAEGQVVDIARPAVEERPDKARFLAEYDSRVDRETKGPSGRWQAGSPQPPSPPAPAQPPSSSSSSSSPGPAPARAGQAGAPERLGPLAMRVPGRPSPQAAPGAQGERAPEAGPSGLQVPGEDGTISRGAEQDPGAAGAGGRRAVPGGGGAPGRHAPNLLAAEPLERALGLGAGSMDHLPDLTDGESTALSAKKWKFASFFNRVKRAVGDEWHPDTVYVRHDPSGNIYGVKDRVTVLRVHLRPDGKLDGMDLLQSCGVGFLDEEAMAAFRRAQPFMNPPPQLREADGLIHFSFAFIFELSGSARPSLKVFKY